MNRPSCTHRLYASVKASPSTVTAACCVHLELEVVRELNHQQAKKVHAQDLEMMHLSAEKERKVSL